MSISPTAGHKIWIGAALMCYFTKSFIDEYLNKIKEMLEVFVVINSAPSAQEKQKKGCMWLHPEEDTETEELLVKIGHNGNNMAAVLLQH